uniref:Major sperm protein n=2 Tax=Parascaris univalens TaxID=6257 RepID=A0A915BAP4_PARUN
MSSASSFSPDKIPDTVLGVPKGSTPGGLSEQTAMSPGSPNCILTPKFIAVEPAQVTFDLSQDRSFANIKITSMNPGRVAWRIRTNAPTRYVVMPTSGFLTSNGNVTASITLIDSHKYHHRHRFMVQAMEAREGEKDRKKIWNDERAEKLDVVQSIRVIASEKASKLTEDSQKESTTTPSSKSSTSSFSTNSKSISDSSESMSTSLAKKEAASSDTPLSDLEYAKKVDELTVKVKGAMGEKAKESQKLIEVVNEVKKIEVELDRTGAQCRDLNDKVAYEETQCKALQEKCAQITNQIRSLKSGSR